jgi:hypothetical protein
MSLAKAYKEQNCELDIIYSALFSSIRHLPK